MKTWNFLEASKAQYHGNGSWTWIGTIANEVRHMVNKAIRQQGISVESHGIEFYDKCVIKYLDASVKAVGNLYSEKCQELLVK